MSTDTIKSVVDLDKFIENAEEWLNECLAKTGISSVHLQNDLKVTCPLNSDHKMPSSALVNHLKYCPLRQQLYSDKEIDLENTSSFFYANAPSVVSVNIDLESMQKICSASRVEEPSVVPHTAERYRQDLSASQRLAVYEHVAEIAKATRQQNELNEQQMNMLTHDLIKEHKKAAEKQPKSEMELLALQRDMKRRRQSYKGKSYTAKKPHKQIIAEVIENQTELLREVWSQNSSETFKEERKSSKSHKSRVYSVPHIYEPKSNTSSKVGMEDNESKYSNEGSSNALEQKEDTKEQGEIITEKDDYTSRNKQRKRSRSKSRRKKRSRSRERSCSHSLDSYQKNSKKKRSRSRDRDSHHKSKKSKKHKKHKESEK